MVMREDCGSHLFCRVSGRLDGQSADSASFLRELNELPKHRHCILDLSDVAYMGSIVLGAIFHFFDQCQQNKALVVLIVTNDGLQGVMTNIGITRTMHVVGSRLEAEAVIAVGPVEADAGIGGDYSHNMNVIQQNIEAILAKESRNNTASPKI